MTDEELQTLVATVSLESFGKPFRHRARFNFRLRTTGGRYLLGSHDIEINPRALALHGMEELVAIIKHELCHYHLHLEGRGYRHADTDFKHLLRQVGGTRYCKDLGIRRRVQTRYLYKCVSCGTDYPRKRKMDTRKYACGACRGRLKLMGYTRLG